MTAAGPEKRGGRRGGLAGLGPLAMLRPALEEMAQEVATRGAFIGVAAVMGVVGLLTLSAALAALLSQWIAWPAALIVTAVAFLAAGAIALWMGVRSAGEKPVAEEPAPTDDELAATASSLFADLPVEAARRLIQDKPLAAIAMASTVGILLARKPEAALDLMQKYFLSDLEF